MNHIEEAHNYYRSCMYPDAQLLGPWCYPCHERNKVLRTRGRATKMMLLLSHSGYLFRCFCNRIHIYQQMSTLQFYCLALVGDWEITAKYFLFRPTYTIRIEDHGVMVAKNFDSGESPLLSSLSSLTH